MDGTGYHCYDKPIVDLAAMKKFEARVKGILIVKSSC